MRRGGRAARPGPARPGARREPQRAAGGMLLALALVLGLGGCSDGDSEVLLPPSSPEGEPYEIEIAGPHGSFLFSAPPLAPADTMVVYYHLGAGADPAQARILFAMHGAGRNASGMRNSWGAPANAQGLLVLAPEFSSELFSGARRYNRGNMHTAGGQLTQPSVWSYRLVEEIFDAVVEAVEGTQTSYAMYGHSAGSQFAHRFHLFMPEHRADLILAANAGWYAFPDLATPFPYGLAHPDAPGGRMVGDSVLAERLSERRLVVLLGEEDNDPNHSQLNRSDGAMAQGEHRFARGLNFHAAGGVAADLLGVEYAWEVVTVPGVAHSNAGMVPAAAAALQEGPLSVAVPAASGAGGGR